MRHPTRSLAAAAATAAVLISPAAAKAFDYPEHRAIAAASIEWVDGHLTGGAELLWQEMERALRDSLSGSHLCGAPDAKPVGRAAAGNRQACFDLSDIPALAGDHSSTPESLASRWLRGDANDYVSGAGTVWRSIPHIANVERAPTVCEDAQEPANAAELLAAVSKSPVTGDDLRHADRAYLCLAGHNAHHFRLRGISPLAAARTMIANAHAAYAYFHLRAVEYGVAGLKEGDAQKRRTLLAKALLYELYSHHFLQDSIAGGHVATNRFELTSGSAQWTHDAHNIQGVSMLVDGVLRDRADDICDTGWKSARTSAEVFYGDSALMNFVNPAARAGRCVATADGAASEAYAVRSKLRTFAAGAALGSLSLEELAAIVGGQGMSQEMAERLTQCGRGSGDDRGCAGPELVGEILYGPTTLLRALSLSPTIEDVPLEYFDTGIGPVFRYQGVGGVARNPGPSWSGIAELQFGLDFFVPAGTTRGWQLVVGATVHGRAELSFTASAPGTSATRPFGWDVLRIGGSSDRFKISGAGGVEALDLSGAFKPLASTELELLYRVRKWNEVSVGPVLKVRVSGSAEGAFLGAAIGVAFEQPLVMTRQCARLARAQGQPKEAPNTCVPAGPVWYKAQREENE